jgi:hypothetical protein
MLNIFYILKTDLKVAIIFLHNKEVGPKSSDPWLILANTMRYPHLRFFRGCLDNIIEPLVYASDSNATFPKVLVHCCFGG